MENVFEHIERFGPFEFATLQSLYTALYPQVEDGLMTQEKFDRQRFVALKAWNLKVQLDLIEKGCTPMSDVIAQVVSFMLDLYLEDVIPKSLFVCVCTVI